MPDAILVLEDGRSFRGSAFGSVGEVLGDIALSTAVFDYQETLANPSHDGQLVLFTTPHIGNTGWDDALEGAERIAAAGLIVRDPVAKPSNWQSTRSLPEALEAQQIVGIAGIDTRALTRHLRGRGPVSAAISSTDTDPARVLERLLKHTGSTAAAPSDDRNSGKDA